MAAPRGRLASGTVVDNRKVGAEAPPLWASPPSAPRGAKEWRRIALIRLIIIRTPTNWPSRTSKAAARMPRNTASNHRLNIAMSAGGRGRSRQVFGETWRGEVSRRIDFRARRASRSDVALRTAVARLTKANIEVRCGALFGVT
jgi:hypothetical protein